MNSHSAHSADQLPHPQNESDFPRITIPPSNQTWALVCCRGYEIVNLRALTLGFALWSYKCPNNFLGRLMFPDWYPMQASKTS